ncbi:MAG: chemotaxis protein CheX [Desulfobacter sp.]|nr:MAG: chemotaxis protein CheX [Desulfobacter sp.]
MIIDHIIPFIDAFAYVMDKYVNLKIKPGEPFYSNGMETFFQESVTSVVALQGKDLSGFVSISFPHVLLFDAACELLSGDKKEARESCESLGGEIVNMVSARGKDVLKKSKGIVFKTSVPSIGKTGFKDRLSKKKTPAVVIPFRVLGKEHIYFSFQIEKESRSA